MSLWSKYVCAKTLDEALNALANAPGPASPIAGGTDLLLDLQQGRQPPVHTLVDVTHIPDLRCLELQGGSLTIGAAVPVAELSESPLIRSHAAALAEACGLIGGPQVRNTATLGGNVGHALPAADGMIALVAMDAQVEIVSSSGVRRVPILSLFRGPGQSALQKEREFIVRFLLPARLDGQASAFGRVMRPQGVALPILNMAIWLEREGSLIKDIRIAIGPAGPIPLRACAVEQVLKGRDLSPQCLEQAKQLLHTSLAFRSSPQRATAGYRHQLSEVLLDEVLTRAWRRAVGEES